MTLSLPDKVRDLLWGIDDGIFDAIDRELTAAQNKHGFTRTPMAPDKSTLESFAILAEEFGEVARAICDIEFTQLQQLRLQSTNLEEELLQTAAMSVAMLIGLRLAERGESDTTVLL